MSAMSVDSTPICVDLDGTLITSDCLLQGIREFVGIDPIRTVLVFAWSLHGRASLKKRISERVRLNVGVLPYRRRLLAHLRREHSRGRILVLCTAADEQIARRIADHLGIFTQVLASNGKRNLKGFTKADVLVTRFGAGQFDYIGDSWADLPVWCQARHSFAISRSFWLPLCAGFFDVQLRSIKG